jgi:AcrR family transcriptional regulator
MSTARFRNSESAAPRKRKAENTKSGDGPTSRVGSPRRLEILAVASRLFATQGFEATSIRQIANELGMVPASLYHHFATKEDMLHEIIEAPTRSLQRSFSKISRQTTPPDQRLIALSEAWFEAWLDDWEAHTITASQSHNFLLKSDFRYIRECMIKNYNIIQLVLEDGVRLALFRQDLNIFYAITAISAIINEGARSLREGAFYTIKPPLDFTRRHVLDIHDDLILRLVRS